MERVGLRSLRSGGFTSVFPQIFTLSCHHLILVILIQYRITTRKHLHPFITARIMGFAGILCLDYKDWLGKSKEDVVHQRDG
jgi:hypothetical protein